jgi:hypothetical protein
MSILTIIKWIIAVGTIATGAFSVFRPTSIKNFTGLDVTGPRGVTEIRAIMGGVFITMGLIPFFYANAYITLGFLYLGIALIRAISMLVDGSVVRSNVISLIVEVLFGGLLLIR